MSSETVSDMRLEELIASATNLTTMPPDSSHAYVIQDWKAAKKNGDFLGFLQSLTELKSLRAQPPAGCAEMADRIAVDSYAEIDHVTGECDEEAIRQVALRNIAPLFTLLAECRPRIVHEVTCATQDHEMYPKSTECKTWLDSQVALLAKLDAALGKGDADGGREEVPFSVEGTQALIAADNELYALNESGHKVRVMVTVEDESGKTIGAPAPTYVEAVARLKVAMGK